MTPRKRRAVMQWSIGSGLGILGLVFSIGTWFWAQHQAHDKALTDTLSTLSTRLLTLELRETYEHGNYPVPAEAK